MFDAGCEPSHHTYSFLIKQLLKEKWTKGSYSNLVDHADVWSMMSFSTALELFDKMQEHGCTPDVNTYAKLIMGLCKVDRFGVALQLFDHMQEQGLSPNEDIYNSLLSCCCKLGILDEAVAMLNHMINSGQLPHLESCKQLVCGLYDDGNKEKAEAVFVSLLGCGYNNDEVAWKILIDGFLKKGLADMCSELLTVMEKRGFQLHPHTYSMIVEGLDPT